MQQNTQVVPACFERRVAGAMLCAWAGIGAGVLAMVLGHLQVI